MGKRTITGILLALVLVPAFWFGGLFLNVVLMLLTLWASYELFKMFNTKAELPKYMLYIEVFLGGFLYYVIQSIYGGSIFVQGNLNMEWAFLLIIGLLVTGTLILVFVES